MDSISRRRFVRAATSAALGSLVSCVPITLAAVVFRGIAQALGAPDPLVSLRRPSSMAQQLLMLYISQQGSKGCAV
jgi:hypothetical protein